MWSSECYAASHAACFKKTNLTLRGKEVIEEVFSCFAVSQATPKPIPPLDRHIWPPHMTLNLGSAYTTQMHPAVVK